MAMKKNIVRVISSTYVDVVVYADESVPYDTIIELATDEAESTDTEIVSQTMENIKTERAEVISLHEDIFVTTIEAYNALLERVGDAGGYIGINKKKRPEIVICNYSNSENERRTIKVLGLFESKDDSSPLKIVDTDGESWDVFDYLGIDDITELYAIVQHWY